MQKIQIEGGAPLNGDVQISGAKNAVLPILCATLLADEPVEISNVPHLHDVVTTAKLLAGLGAEITVDQGTIGKGSESGIVVDPRSVNSHVAPYELVKTMRASVLVLGPLLAKYGAAEVSLPGGCAIGSRPVDLHIKGMQALGAEISVDHGFIKARADRLKGGRDRVRHGQRGRDRERVDGGVSGAGHQRASRTRRWSRRSWISPTASMRWVRRSKARAAIASSCTVSSGCMVRSMRSSPDRIETGTFLVAGAMTGGRITARRTRPETLDAVLEKLMQAGAQIEIEGDRITLDMQGRRPKAVNITTNPHPAFPTDMQAQFMAMNCIAEGVAVINETIFENRFMHVQELQRLGADIRVEGHTAIVRGVEKLSGAPVMATDLRASASLILAGLVADGETVIDRIYHLDRGYENIEEKLSGLGARIRRVG